jgi:hypothetical protein
MIEITIFDRDSFFARNEKIHGENFRGWFFLGNNIFDYHTVKKKIGTAKEIDIREEFSKSINELRNPFVEYIGSLEKKRLHTREIYSGFFERVPFKSDLFQNLCYIHCATNIVSGFSEGTIWIICQDTAVACDLIQSLGKDPRIRITSTTRKSQPGFRIGIRTFFRVLLHTGLLAVIVIYRKILSTGTKGSLTKISKDTDFLIIHTWVGKGSYQKGDYEDLFYGDLYYKLKPSHPECLLVPHIPYDKSFIECMQSMRKSDINVLYEESCLSITDIISISLDCIQNYPVMMVHSIGGIVFSHCVYLQSFNDWRDIQIFYPKICECFIKRMAQQKLRLKSLIFTYENNAWDKAVIATLHKIYPPTTIIGYQHSTVSTNQLNFNLASDERTIELLPDYIITNGKYPYNFLSRHGYPLNRLVFGGALRYYSIKKQPLQSNIGNNSNKTILVALPASISESVEIIEKVNESLHDMESLTILCKIHPFISQKRIMQYIPKETQKKIRFIDEKITELLPRVNLLVYSGTSVSIEALTYHIPVLKINSGSRIDLDPLQDFQSRTLFIATAMQPSEIRTSIMNMINLKCSEEEGKLLDNIIEEIFEPVGIDTYNAFLITKTIKNNKMTS